MISLDEMLNELESYVRLSKGAPVLDRTQARLFVQAIIDQANAQAAENARDLIDRLRAQLDRETNRANGLQAQIDAEAAA